MELDSDFSEFLKKSKLKKRELGDNEFTFLVENTDTVNYPIIELSIGKHKIFGKDLKNVQWIGMEGGRIVINFILKEYE